MYEVKPLILSYFLVPQFTHSEGPPLECRGETQLLLSINGSAKKSSSTYTPENE